MGIRTPDIQLAKLALYQLSYTPANLCGANLRRNARRAIRKFRLISLSAAVSWSQTRTRLQCFRRRR